MTIFTKAVLTVGASLAALLAAVLLAAHAGAQPPGVTVLDVKVTCPSGSGRLDITLSNATTDDRQVTIGFDGVRLPLSVPALATADAVITGRADGTRDLSIDDGPGATVTVFCGFPDGPEFDVQLTPDCSGGVGILQVSITNPSDVEALAVVTPTIRVGASFRREVVVGPGATETIRISGRDDGFNDIAVNGRLTSASVYIDCVASTGPNDLISNAKPVTLTAPFVVIDPEFDRSDTYGHTQAELDDQTRCIATSNRGSAWYSFVATTNAISVGWSDDSQLAFYRPLVDEPTVLADLEPIACGERPDVAVTPGQTYLVAVSLDVEPELNRLYPMERASNATLATARDLSGDFDATPDLLAQIEPAENTECFAGAAESNGTLWWKWTATTATADFDLLSHRFGSFSDPLARANRAVNDTLRFAVFQSDEAAPSHDDLQLVSCEAAPVEVGRTYWIQVNAGLPQLGTTLIGLPDGGISAPELDVVCVNESGRFEISVSNSTDAVIPVEIATRYDTGRPFGQQRPVYRSFELEAGAARTQVITGRADGLHSIWVLAGTKALGVPEQPVDCQPDPTMVEVSVSCLAGRGRIDVVFPPTDGPPRPLYAVRYVGPKSTLERVRLGNELSTQVTVTGRENGEFSIEATIDGESAFDGVVTVACD